MRIFQRKNQIIIVISAFIVLMIGQAAFAEGGFISGRVTKSDGKTPIAKVRIRAYNVDQKGYIGRAKTKVNGEYVVENIVSGQYTVLATLSGYVDSTKRNISVLGNKVTENINFILIEEAIVSGKVTESNGVTPIPNVEISIDGSDKTLKGAAMTDEKGKYQISQLPPDKYWIRAEKNGYAMQVTFSTAIEEGQKIIDLNFRLENAATISGTIMIKNTTIPIEKAVIFIGSESRLYGYTITDASGNYLLEDLPSGPCDILIRAKNYALFSSEINIPSGANITNKNFYLQPRE